MENIDHRQAHKFTDVVRDADDQSTVVVDVNAQQMLTSLQRDKIAAVFDPRSIAHFDLCWEDPEETGPNEDAVYLGQFMEVFEGKMLTLIQHAVSQQSAVTCDAHVVEILQHLTVCRQRSQVCHTHARTLCDTVLARCMGVCLSVCLSVCLPACLPAYLPVCLDCL